MRATFSMPFSYLSQKTMKLYHSLYWNGTSTELSIFRGPNLRQFHEQVGISCSSLRPKLSTTPKYSMAVRLRSQLRQHLYLPFVKVLLLILFERRLRREPSSFYLPPRGYKEKGCLRHPEADCKGLVGQNLGKRCGSPKMQIVPFYFHSLEEIHASCWAAWLMI